MRNRKMKSKKFRINAKGITLIALVITIIVLLILAGVSIAILTGENGILTRAQEAKTKTEQSGDDELRKLTQAEAATHLEEYEYIDVSGEKITIPAKCAVSQVEGENTLADGLVIIDVNGNEWVWIEVPENVTASAKTDIQIEEALINYAQDYRGDYSDTWYEGCGLESQEYADIYSKMLQSIKVNGGFYIGRYEAGSFDAPVTDEDITRKSVIQEGAYPYNLVTCSQAENLAEGLAIGGKTSTLMFGIQWDLVLKYLETNGILASELKNDSSSWGNYGDVTFSITRGKYSTDNGVNYTEVPSRGYFKPASVVLLTTGATERNEKMNIYDLAGNLYEWTLEKSIDNAYPCALRGGNIYDAGNYHPAAFRDFDSTSVSYGSHGFRPALY